MLTKLFTSPLKLKIGLIVLFTLTINLFTPNFSLAIKQNPPIVMEWKINGVVRKALVYLPVSAKTKATPILFAFHGHGGNMTNFYNTRRFDQLWPEAIFICPQGLNTVGKLTDPEGKLPGWQMNDDAGNTDLLFFDAMLKTLKTDYKVDEKKIFATGHSNGGGFTYLLWATRGDIFAAMAPTASVAAKLQLKLKPKPALHLMGSNDQLVKTAWQEQTCNYLMKLNKCNPKGIKIDDYQTLYESETGNPLIVYVFPGGHAYPIVANNAIISFFKKLGVRR